MNVNRGWCGLGMLWFVASALGAPPTTDSSIAWANVQAQIAYPVLPKMTSQEFSSYLLNNVAELQKGAEQSGVLLPNPRYGFSFEPLREQINFDAASIEPMVSWGTSPEHSISISGTVPLGTVPKGTVPTHASNCKLANRA